ncbi:TIGR03752 family integrating conjugative element protein [Lampropedia puyangensis]|uniref:TIGR03752 family integrating conjugative element protein n=1 Tax=Lampropedia puyangensis TaxID=1330072 RepID=A0A4S8EV72_9BURK|nr:TIGR03752 family integrating conjugative element protein [Lampropedia puyangensis]THT98406.1 TIGR03752 family integrating conjugative element protein [Lampropedia puyangensis]
MATSNRLLPVMAGVVAIIGSVILVQKCSSGGPVRSGSELQKVPTAPTTEDGDTIAESLRTVTTSNNSLRDDVQKLLQQNEVLMAENTRLKAMNRPSASSLNTANTPAMDRVVDLGALPAADGGFSSEVPPEPNAGPTSTDTPFSTIGKAIDSAASSASQFGHAARQLGPDTSVIRKAARENLPQSLTVERLPDETGQVAYRALPPMGYQAMIETGGRGKAPVTRYVRTSAAVADQQMASAQSAVQRAAKKAEDVPYFTLPDNSTLVDVQAMTAIIGRVPVDGRVTDPMQFKAIVGRENLAANGWQLPGDIEGMIVSGIAVGDMALSCSEGLIQSMTFIFNDGTVQTVQSKQGNSNNINTQNGTRRSTYMGYISDLHGNPCIVGKFVTNAPRYLTDIVGLKALQVAGQQYANAQTTTTQRDDGGYNNSVTGSRTDFVMGSAAASAANEVSDWLLSRLQNSFDAVVTPSGANIVVHLTQEVRLDKVVNARKIIHRQQGATSNQRGGHYGLE